MNILLTGASGFLGKRIVKCLPQFDIVTLGRSANSNVKCDLSTEIPLLPATDLVVHAAGMAHMVPKSQIDKQKFIDVNVNGTRNLLKGLEEANSLPSFFVFISSVSVYGLEAGIDISESSVLKATEAYGRSKIEAEAIIQEWCLRNNVKCSILRLPLLVGADPPGNLGAMIRAIDKGYYFNIAGGKAKKSMVFVDDVASLIPKVAQIGGIYNLTDGQHPTFNELSAKIARDTGKSTPLNIPLWMAKIMAIFGDIVGAKAPINSNKLKKINSDLTFNDAKARREIGWKPQLVLEVFNTRNSI